MKINTKIK